MFPLHWGLKLFHSLEEVRKILQCSSLSTGTIDTTAAADVEVAQSLENLRRRYTFEMLWTKAEENASDLGIHEAEMQRKYHLSITASHTAFHSFTTLLLLKEYFAMSSLLRYSSVVVNRQAIVGG